jgi:DNA-binding HxlR family transcriptional regulator
MSANYNQTKRAVLAHFERMGWQTPREIQAVIRWRSLTRVYQRLREFAAWQLLSRRTLPRLEYRLTAKGRARLAWLWRQKLV